MKISTVSQMRDLDRTAIDRFGITEELLMENAGEAVYFLVANELGVPNRRFVVVCGMGNNGGDGFVIARKLHSGGGRVKVFILGDPGKFKGAARLNLDILSRLPIPMATVESAATLRKDVLHCDAVVDALFGTGLSRDVTGLHREVIEIVNTSPALVFSADIPSGVHGDTGQIMGQAVRSDFTVTFGLPKLGNLFFPGYSYCGKLYVTHISFPPSMYETEAMKVAVNSPTPLPARKPDGHKGDMGDVLFVAGAAGYFGAPYFSAVSFLKAGGGYSRLAAPKSIIPVIASRGREIVFLPQAESRSGGIAPENAASLITLAGKADMVVLGPGLGLESGTQELVRELARRIDKPLLVDGDGITALCEDLDGVRQRRSETVLTPHMGEMARLVNMTVPAIEGDRVGLLQRTARDLNAVIVMKGAHSLIGMPDQQVFVNLSGNSGMATAGSGDVLTGAIAAMFGAGLSVEAAVRKGVFIHGLAGDLAAEDKGEDGITAQDIMDYLPHAVKLDREGINAPLRHRYAGPAVI